ncbi:MULTISPECIES: histidine kinase [unclassified Streptomyces]
MRLAQGEVAWAQAAILVGVTAALGTVFALNFTIGHLRTAGEQFRRLAVNKEREQVARDMHDVLGHSLSTLACASWIRPSPRRRWPAARAR